MGKFWNKLGIATRISLNKSRIKDIKIIYPRWQLVSLVHEISFKCFIALSRHKKTVHNLFRTLLLIPAGINH